MPTGNDDQAALDREDSDYRLRRLVDALCAVETAKESLRSAENELKRSQQRLKSATEAATMLSFQELSRRRRDG